MIARSRAAPQPHPRLGRRLRPGPRRRLVALAALTCLLTASACSGGGDDPQASPSATETSEPAPPPVQGIHGERIIDTKSVANGPAVFNAGDPNAVDPAPDTAAIAAFAERVAAWLDVHLGTLQAGQPGNLAEVAAPGLLDGADPAVLGAVTTALASPARPVASSRYTIVVAHVGTPVWLHVTAETTAPDGAVASAQFVFTPGEPPLLQAAGPTAVAPA